MTSPQRPHEGDNGKAEGSGPSRDERSPMHRFKSLTKAIIGVTREQIREQERRNEEAKTSRHKLAS
jgi:hypothetical protein